MSWSYSGDPSTSNLDYVRFLCGDTDPDAPLMQDEEINFILTKKTKPENAAIDCARTILSKLARQVDYTIGPEHVAASERFKQYKQYLDDLITAYQSNISAPSLSTCQRLRGPVFRIGMFDNRRGY